MSLKLVNETYSTTKNIVYSETSIMGRTKQKQYRLI